MGEEQSRRREAAQSRRSARASEDPSDPTDPAWHPDPFARHQRRWWDGERWSSRVRDDDRIGIDPPVIEPKPEALVPRAPVAPIDEVIAPLPRTNWPTIIGLVVAAGVLIALLVLAVLSV